MYNPHDDFDEFETKINGTKFMFRAYFDSIEFLAEAYLNDRYCNTAISKISIEDAILKLVKLLENDK